MAPSSLPTPLSTAQLARQANLEKRNLAIRDAFYKRFTIQPKVNGVRIYTREGILAALALEYHLSMTTVERIVAPKAK